MTEHLKFVRDNLENILAYSLLSFIPTQLGRHFWPSFSFVVGERIDYLSPTLYASDILIFLLFLLWIISKSSHAYLNKKVPIWFLPAGIFLFINTILAVNPVVSWYGLVKLIEFCFFGGYMGYFFVRHKESSLIIIGITLLAESALAIVQYFHQGSLNGLFWFFGEREFSGITPGIANVSVGGHLILRPYGTFSHPNVLGAYLLIMGTLLIGGWKEYSSAKIKSFIAVSLGCALMALVLTLSRSAILLCALIMIGLICQYFMRKAVRKRFFIVSFVGAGFLILSFSILFPMFSERFAETSLSDESVILREILGKSALLMIAQYPLLGVGNKNFLIMLPKYLPQTHTIFTIQPVHNLPLLVASEFGIPGLLLSIFLIGKVYYRIYRRFFLSSDKRFVFFLGVILTEIMLLGMIDHYFLTLQQGQLMLSLIIGVSLSV